MFFIGGMLVASGPVGQIFTPLDVNYVRHSEDVISASKEEYLHPDAPVNLARLLQTLDSDGYPENGITITEETANEFSNSFESIYGTEVFDQSTEGFASHLEEHIGEYTNTSTLVSVEDAVNHMSASLSDLKSDYTINLVGQTWVTQLKELRQYVSFDNRDSWGEPTICTETDMNIYSIDKYHTNHVEVEIHDNFNATTCTATGSRSFETTNYGRYTMCPSSECNYSDLNRITGWEENSEENHRREKETRHHIMGSDKVITIHEIQFTDDDKDYWQVARYESARNP
ncbi:hypothetical protein [Oleiphilus sp. HI0117]|nr:hypothetical protein [Oleiphilus sp. HI0117]